MKSEREQTKARDQYLADLAQRVPESWHQVEDLIGMKSPTDYDRAVALLVDLRDLAKRSGQSPEVEARIRELRQRHRYKPSLLKRIDNANLRT